MKREILFRGKDIETDEWIEGGVFASESKTKPEFARTFIVCGMVDFKGIMFEVSPKTIGQFTGLTDKNGKKIFENDVIDGLVVSYCGDTDAGLGMQAGWYLQRDDFESFTPLESNLTDIVDGNVFDNPELAAKND